MNSLWYIFFDDIWYNNSDNLKELNDFYFLFNPEFPSFLGFHLMPRVDLELILKACNLEKFFNNEILTLLYSKLNEISKDQSRFDFVNFFINFIKIYFE